jgi:N6-L-threonylcarbamoyladenine synthase
MKILSIDTSCDETSVAITEEKKTITHIEFSQIKIHQPYGGVYPSLAKREHLSKIKPAIHLALKRAHLSIRKINAFAVTFGPGLAPALEVGINTAKGLAKEYNKPLIPVDHIEGHIYSSFVQNSAGKPNRSIKFPFLAFVISGGHTQLVLVTNHIEYQIIGETLDDAAGEALDKAARMLGLGYPGGAIIERLAKTGNNNSFILPIGMQKHQGLDFSFSGLKTAFNRLLREMSEDEINSNLENLAASFQNAVFTALLVKLERALKNKSYKIIVFGGGVSANMNLRKRTRKLTEKYNTKVYFPSLKYLSSDNASMIGVVAHYKYQKGLYLKNPDKLDRTPRASLDTFV